MKEAHSIEQLLLQIRDVPLLKEDSDIRNQLIDGINHLIGQDFNKLVLILYRVDVSEKKLRQILAESPQTDAAILIADLLIQRQLEKIRSREKFRKDEKDIPEDDKW
jgi:hypothetical protein